MTAAWFLIPCGVGALIGALLTLPTASLAVRQFGARRRLPALPPSGHAALVRRSRMATLWGCAVVVLALALATVIVVTYRLTEFDQWALVLAVYPAAALGAAAHAALSRTFRPAPGTPRVASARRQRVTDAIPSAYAVFPDRLLWVLLVVAVAGTVTLIASGRPIPVLWIGIVHTALAALLATFRLLERAVLSRPQPVSDATQLAWDQALRGQTLFGLRQVQAATVTAATGIVVAVTLGGLIGPEARQVCIAFTAAAANLVLGVYALRLSQHDPAPAAEGAQPA